MVFTKFFTTIIKSFFTIIKGMNTNCFMACMISVVGADVFD
jgi:hypothetical protein